LEIAEHYLTRNPNYTEPDLQTMLIQECDYLERNEGRASREYCLYVVTNNMNTIYATVKAGEDPLQVCYTIGACASPTGTDVPLPTYTASARPPRRLSKLRNLRNRQVLAPVSQGCRDCNMVLNIAAQTLQRDPNITEQQMGQELGRECQRLHGQDAQNCENNIHNQTIMDVIFKDLKGGKTVDQCCMDIGACNANGTLRFAAPRRVAVPRKRDAQTCRTCTIVMSEAERIYQAQREPDLAKFEADMLNECEDLKQHEGAAAEQYCVAQINANAATIFGDVQQGMHAADICGALGDCP